MPDNATLLSALQSELIAAAIARKPGTAPSGSLRPLFLEPADGAPAPGEKKGNENDAQAILSVFVSGGIPPRPYESFWRSTTVDLWIRTAASNPKLGYQLDKQLRDRLIDRRNWLMGTGADQLTVIESQLWRDLQRLGSDSGQGFTFIMSFLFQIYND